MYTSNLTNDLFVNKGKLNFVGRSGTALDVRYSSHGHGESPENTTPYVLAYLANQSLGILRLLFVKSTF